MWERRRIGNSELQVTPLALGCWPIAGITSINVTETDSLATISAAREAGINFFDTAYCYGYEGESERMVGQVLRPHRDQVVIATKGGIHWNADKKQERDGRRATLLREVDESLQRLGTDYIDLYYLHAPDPATPLAESAGAIRDMIAAGKIRAAGASNFTREQLAEFHAVCPLAAFQPHYNMLQREIESSQLPWCIEHNVSAIIYWPLMKGLLAGKLARNHVFDPRDGRKKYPMFQGDEWNRNQDFLDELRALASEWNVTVPQLVLNWTIQQPGIDIALCGAKRPDQIRDNAAALNWKLSPAQLQRIDLAIAARGSTVSRAAVT